MSATTHHPRLHRSQSIGAWGIRVAFLVLALARLGSTATAEPLRLSEIFVIRVVEHEGEPAQRRGLLSAAGEFTPFDPAPLPFTESVPAEAIDQDLIVATIYFGYDVLGPEALNNFVFDFNVIMIGDQGYFAATPAAEPNLTTGDLVNISTRSVVTPGGEPMIGGFVIEDQPRWVLIRGVGPTLAELDVPTPLTDPEIAVFRVGENTPIASNDDWDQQANADDIEIVSAEVGAFPLPRGSSDAVYLAELPPGGYTVHLRAGGDSSGTGLLEIYRVTR